MSEEEEREHWVGGQVGEVRFHWDDSWDCLLSSMNVNLQRRPPHKRGGRARCRLSSWCVSFMLQVFDTRQAAESRRQHLWSGLHVFPMKVCKRRLGIGPRAFMQRSKKHRVWLWLLRGDVFWSSCKRRLCLITMQWLSEKKLHAAWLNVRPPHNFLLTSTYIVFF